MIARAAFEPGLPQFLNYECFVAEGVMKLKDGALMLCVEYVGPDQNLHEHLRRAWEADGLSQALRFGNGWMLEAHTICVPVTVPQAAHHCPDTTSGLVYEERAQKYSEPGVYLQTRHVLAITYLPPADVQRTLSEYFFSSRINDKKFSQQQLVEVFIREVNAFIDGLGRTLTLRRLSESETVHFLRYCVTGEDRGVGIPEDGDNLDYAIGTVDFAPHTCQVGDLHTSAVGIIGWPGDGTRAQMFDPILQLDFPLRLQQRFIFLSTRTVVKTLERRRNWANQLNDYNPFRLGWKAVQPASGVDPDNKRVVRFNKAADNQAASIEDEIMAIESGEVIEGYYTLCVILHDIDQERLAERTARVTAEINKLGFTAITESDNLADAVGGSWPGHGVRNVRKHILNTRHFTRLWSWTSPWAGEEQAPCPFYPPESGPLLLTTTTGKGIYRMNIHAHDLGNFLNIGPSGNGKSFANGEIAMAFRQYENSQIFILDRGAALYVPTVACGGEFFDAEALSYAPLARIDEEKERSWALTFIEQLATLRRFHLTPQASGALTEALQSLSTRPLQFRTMTGFLYQLQSRREEGLKDALSFYTVGNPGAILDGVPGPEHEASWQTYDMERLIGAGEEISTPVIHYLLHMMDRKADGRPMLKIVEEGWQVAGNKLLQRATEEDSANNRKQNIATGLVLHSPANITAFERHELLLTNMATLLLLPNEKAMTEGPDGAMQHYLRLGLTRRHCQALATGMRPRQDYMLVKGENSTIFQFDSGPFAKVILGVNGRDHRAHIEDLRKEYGEEWLPVWFRERGHQDLAAQWHERNKQGREAV